ncbi:hypothetical protein B0H14DRAFT_3147172, partial [Mycena olivaceomarginata]
CNLPRRLDNNSSQNFFASPLLVFSHHLIALFLSSSRLCAPSYLWTPAFSPPPLRSRKRVQKCPSLVNVSHSIQTTSAYTIDAYVLLSFPEILIYRSFPLVSAFLDWALCA